LSVRTTDLFPIYAHIPSERGSGVGAHLYSAAIYRIVQDALEIRSRLPSLVLFETEKISDSKGKDRIHFFRKMGAEFCPIEYFQPSLSMHGCSVNLHLMYHPVFKHVISRREWLRIIKSIYRDVYGIRDYESEEAFKLVLSVYGNK
jgi:hypothetical protein